MGRPPRPEDLIVPSRRGNHRNVNHMGRRLHEDLERLGLRQRNQHDFRRTFISLAQVLPALRATAAQDADFVLLIKPQFEVGKQGVREGIVRDAGLRADAISDVLWAAHDAGLGTAHLLASPIAGGHGNHEYLVHLRAGAPDDADETVRTEWGTPGRGATGSTPPPGEA